MKERKRKLLDTKDFDGIYRRKLLVREIQRPDQKWIQNWFGLTYNFVNDEVWIKTPEGPMFKSKDKGEEWLTSPTPIER